MKILNGIPVSKGTATGKAFIIEHILRPEIPAAPLIEKERQAGWARLTAALLKVRSDIKALLETPDPEQQAIFESYLLMLSDTDFISQVEQEYQKQNHQIEFVLNEKVEDFASKLRAAGDAYLSARADDITDVFGRVLNELLGVRRFDYSQIPEHTVIVAKSLSPSEVGELAARHCSAIILEEGGVNSHLAILTRNYSIPALFAVPHAVSEIHTGDMLIVDTQEEKIIISPDSEVIDQYLHHIAQEEMRRNRLASNRQYPALLRDGTPITVLANIGSVEEARIALDEGADGIGLFRTEFLFMQAANQNKKKGKAAVSISEENQFQAYKEVLQIMKGKPVTIRTLDAGGDKIINAADIPIANEKNPLLGQRAIRLTLADPPLFRTQLRALYRASMYGELKIMLPLVTHVAQVKETFRIIKEVQSDLMREQIPFRTNVPVGIMVETAAAAVIADVFTQFCDFFSIGTNDLTQYTLGIDRENRVVADLFSEFHAGVLRLIAYTVQSARTAGIPVSVCGEMAGQEEGMKVLAGLGVRTLSMTPSLICEAKEILSHYTLDELEQISAKAFPKLPLNQLGSFET